MSVVPRAGDKWHSGFVRDDTYGDLTVKVAQGNVTLNTTDIEIGQVKLRDGTTTSTATVSASGAVKVDGSAVTQPVSGTVTVANPTANPETGLAKDVTLTTRLPGALDADGGLKIHLQNSVAVTGTFWQATQPVSGTFWQATQPVSALQLPAALGQATQTASLPVVIASDQSALAEVATAASQASLPALLKAVAAYDTDQQKTQPIPVAQINGRTTLVVSDSRTRAALGRIELLLERLLDERQ